MIHQIQFITLLSRHVSTKDLEYGMNDLETVPPISELFIPLRNDFISIASLFSRSVTVTMEQL